MRSKIRKFINTLPFVDPAQRNHPVEYALLNRKHQNTNHHPSILHFSLNKSATQYVKKVLQEAATSIGMTTAHFNGYAFHSDFPYLDLLSKKEFQKYQYLFKPQGYLYSVFGGMIDGLTHLSDYLVVLMIRDPRDIVVSSYFSTAYSHPLPGQHSDKADDFHEKREQTQQMSVDEYALQESEVVLKVYERYMELLLQNHPNCYVTKYEDMVADHEIWLKDLLVYCKLDISEELLEKLLHQHQNMRPKKENVNDHMRKGKAGDFLDKLQPETISVLNDKFAVVLERFGYE